MKLCFFLISSFFPLFFIQSSIYDIQVETIDGKTVNLSVYKGKTIIVAEFNAAQPDRASLQYIDSLQMVNKSSVVIAVPALDFGGTANEKSIVALRDSLGLQILITKPAFVKKTAGKIQQELFKWLTDVNNNRHFDYEVEEPWQLFIINSKGTLYSLLRTRTPRTVINESMVRDVKE